MLGENAEQFDHGLVLFGGNYFGGKKGLPQRLQLDLDSPFGHEFSRAFELSLGWFLPEDLPGLKKTDDAISKPDRDRSVTQAVGAGECLRFIGRSLREFFLHRKARSARAAAFRKQRAEGAFVAFPVVRQLPGFDRTQSDRKSGGLSKSSFVFLKNFRAQQGFDQAAIQLAVVGWRGLWLAPAARFDICRCNSNSPIRGTRSINFPTGRFRPPNICCLHEDKLGENAAKLNDNHTA